VKSELVAIPRSIPRSIEPDEGTVIGALHAGQSVSRPPLESFTLSCRPQGQANWIDIDRGLNQSWCWSVGRSGIDFEHTPQ
jgi:hypothetical protein